MKVLIHIPQLIFGGAEKVLVSFANDLVNRGHEVEVLESYERGLLKDQFDSRVTFNAICSNEYTKKYYSSLDEIKNEKNLFKKVVKCGKKLFSTVVGYRRFAEKLCAKQYKDKQYDVAINYLEIEPPVFILEHINARKYFQWFHADISMIEDSKTIDSYIPEYLKTDAVVCVSESAKNNFVARYSSLKDKTFLIYNFFDSEHILSSAIPSYDYGTDSPVLLSVGRLTPQKAYPRFIKILGRLRDEGMDFSYHILGDGIQKEEIQDLIAELDLSDRVTLHGLTDNPYKYMAGCDLFVLPSVWEAFPTVTVEAKVLNKPVFATNVSGISEQIIHGASGYVVDNSEAAIYQGLKYILTHMDLLENLKTNASIPEICNNDSKYEKFLHLCGV